MSHTAHSTEQQCHTMLLKAVQCMHLCQAAIYSLSSHQHDVHIVYSKASRDCLQRACKVPTWAVDIKTHVLLARQAIC
jgi:hypothetical protein